MAKFSVNDIKDSGINFVNSVKSGEFTDKIKHGFQAFKGDHSILPKQLQQKLEALDKRFNNFLTAQKNLENEALQLKREVSAFCHDAIDLYSSVADKSSKTKTDNVSPTVNKRDEDGNQD